MLIISLLVFSEISAVKLSADLSLECTPEGHHILRIENAGKSSVFIEKELDTSYFKAIDIWFKAKFDNIWFL